MLKSHWLHTATLTMLCLAGPLAGAGCESSGTSGEGVTEIIVSVESDLEVPTELDRVTLGVVGASASTTDADLERAPLPQTLSLRHSGGPLGPFQVEAIGYRSGAEIARTSASVSFVRGQTTQQTLRLARGCSGPLCDVGGADAGTGGDAGPSPQMDAGAPDAAQASDAGPDASAPGCTPACKGPKPICTSDGTCNAGEAGDPCSIDRDCNAVATLCGPNEVCQIGTEGEPCASGDDCAPGSALCSSAGKCQDGSVGDVCTLDSDCGAPTPLCGPQGQCQSGEEGNTCANPSDCGAATPLCTDMNVCQDGSEGDPCVNQSECGRTSKICAATGCQNGSEGDGCEDAGDCDSANAAICSSAHICQNGTDGDACVSPADCDASYPVCTTTDRTCRDDSEGGACSVPGDCGLSFNICGPNDTCQNGDEGDACSSPADCDNDGIGADYPLCGPDGTCQNGDAGDACGDNADCGASAPLCSPAGSCQAGAEGDPCASGADCSAGAALCGADSQCQDGSQGDACSTPADCAAGMPICNTDGECSDGTAGDACGKNADCTATARYCRCATTGACSPSGVCQAGIEGDPCAAGSDCAASAPICNTGDKTCTNGSPGDDCGADSQCVSATAPYCGSGNVCECTAGRLGCVCAAGSCEAGAGCYMDASAGDTVGTCIAMPGPIAHWNFDGDATDSSAAPATPDANHPYDGTASNVSYVAGPNGDQAADFNDTSYVSAHGFGPRLKALVDADGEFTASIRIRFDDHDAPSDSTPDYHLFGLDEDGESSGSNRWKVMTDDWFSLPADRGLNLLIDTETGSGNNYRSTITALDRNDLGVWFEWTFVFKRSGSSTSVDLYEDGVFVTTDNYTAPTGLTTEFWIGGKTWTNDDVLGLDGTIDDLQFFDVALTPEQISALPSVQ